MSDFLNEQVKILVDKINKDKENLILQRIKERVFLNQEDIMKRNFDLVSESQRRFPRIVRELRPNQEESYYWNDGTENGLHLITFYQKAPEVKNVNEVFKMEMEVNYI